MFTADLKLSITQPASSVCPSILSPVEGAGLGGHFPALLCPLQASIFLTPGSQTSAVLSCLAPSSALMDVSGWMGPPPSTFIPTAVPQHPSSPELDTTWGWGPQSTPLELRDRVCLVPGSGGLTVGNLSHPSLPGFLPTQALTLKKEGSHRPWMPTVSQAH